MAPVDFKYFAFISYNHVDFRWGKRLFHKLESYKLSSSLCKLYGWSKRKPFSPIFFAPYEIQPNELSEELKERLRKSKNLIVICSPHSAHSKWVGLEIEYFYKLGRKDSIYFFIIDGELNAKDYNKECYNEVIYNLGLSSKLGVNIHEKVYSIPWLNKERAYIQLVTKLLGIEFDTVWQRHRKQLIFQLVSYVFILVFFILSLLLVWNINQPQTVSITLVDRTSYNNNLPPFENGIIKIQVGDSIQTYLFQNITQTIHIPNVPFKLIGKRQKIKLLARGYNTVDTLMTIQKKIEIPILRDKSYYGSIKGVMWNKTNDSILCNTEFEIGTYKFISDSKGVIDIMIPEASQNTSYDILQDGVKIGEIFMPFQNQKIIVTK